MNHSAALAGQAAPATPTGQPDLQAVKARQQLAWASGDFGVVGITLQITGEALCEAVDLRAGERVLDVAAGNGNATLAAARRFARVVSTDYVAHLLDKGRERAASERLPVEFHVADAENLPFDDGAFDVVLSTFGVMFSPDQAAAAGELLRVTRPGGRIGLANWTPEGFIGQLFKTIGRHLPPPSGLKSPALWGTEGRLAELFGPWAAEIRVERRHFNFRYRSAVHWIEVFRNYYGPVLKAFEGLDNVRQLALTADLGELLEKFNRGGAESLVVPGEYLEVVITRI